MPGLNARYYASFPCAQSLLMSIVLKYKFKVQAVRIMVENMTTVLFNFGL